MEKQGYKRPAYTLTKGRLKEAEATLRELMGRKFPPLPLAVDELTEAGNFGPQPSFLSTVIQLVCEDFRKRLAERHPLIPRSIARMKRAQRRSSRRGLIPPRRRRRLVRSTTQAKHRVLCKRGKGAWK